jgi:hypothetical protein
MMNAIARRLRRLEELEFQHRAELGPSPGAILLERRRKRAIAEGREPEPDPPPGRLIDSRGRPLSLADVLLQHRKNRETSESLRSGESHATRPENRKRRGHERRWRAGYVAMR